MDGEITRREVIDGKPYICTCQLVESASEEQQTEAKELFKPERMRPKRVIIRRKRNTTSFNTYIKRVNQSLHECTLSRAATQTMNQLMLNFLDIIGRDTEVLCRYSKRKTLTDREIRASLSMIFPKELFKACDEAGQDALNSYHQSP